MKKNYTRGLEKEGIFTLVMPSPFPQVEDIRAYLIDAGGKWFMVDTGVKTPDARESLFKRMEEIGVKPEDVTTIFITHHHIDHAGNARLIAEKGGGSIYIHPAEGEKIEEEKGPLLWERSKDTYGEFFRKIGMPESVINFLNFFDSRFDQFIDLIPRHLIKPVHPGSEYRIGDCTIRALNFPGHTPGMINYFLVERGILFSGDHIIKTITPNALLELDEKGNTKKALISYMNSLEKTCELKIRMALSGHGDPVTDIEEHVEKLFQFYERRKQRVLKALEEAGPMKLYDLTLTVFPMVRLYDIYLAVSEVLGLIELLEWEDRVRRFEKESFEYWEITGN